jgi:hypothetical protein
MKTLCVMMMAAGLVALPRIASATGMSGVSDEAKSAFDNITKAKSSLSAGDTKASDGYLSKAEGYLKSAMDKSPSGSAQATPGTTNPSAPSGSSSNDALSKAQGEGQKMGQEPANPSAPASGSAGSATEKSSTSSLQGVYDQVGSARSAIKSGDISQAKSILDKIPASPNDLLKVH